MQAGAPSTGLLRIFGAMLFATLAFGAAMSFDQTLAVSLVVGVTGGVLGAVAGPIIFKSSGASDD